MPNVLILEDDCTICNGIAKWIQQQFPKCVCYTAYDEQEGMMVAEQEDIHVFLLDIQLTGEEDTSGIIFGRKIRQMRRYLLTPILIITSISELELSAFRELQCHSFFIKPMFHHQLKEQLDKIFLGMEQQEHIKYLDLMYSNHIYRIQQNQIIFIETIARNLIIHTVHEDIRLNYQTMNNIMKRLDKYMFVRCHRSFCVNIHFVKQIDMRQNKLYLLDTENPIDCGRIYVQNIKSIWQSLCKC